MQLQRVPVEWVDDGLLSALRRRDALRVAGAALDATAAAAESAVAAAVAAVEAGDAGAVDRLLEAVREQHSAAAARRVVPPPELSADAVAPALQRAESALQDAAKSLAFTALAADTDQARWRQHCTQRGQAFDPPIVTDLERRLSARCAAMSERVERQWASGRAWSSTVRRPGAADPLTMLESAADQIRQIQELAVEVRDLAADVERANALRDRAGHGWRAPTPVGFITAFPA